MSYKSFVEDAPTYANDYRIYDIGNGITLTAREAYIAGYLLNSFIPTLKRILFEANPAKFKRWGGNCCRQAAVLVRESLKDTMNDYKWIAYEGTFTDGYGTYEHAFVVGTKDNDHILVDLSRQAYPSLFMHTEGVVYPSFNEYSKSNLDKYVVLDADLLMNLNEYYTEMNGHELFKLVKERCRFDDFDLPLRIHHKLYPLIKSTISRKELQQYA